MEAELEIALDQVIAIVQIDNLLSIQTPSHASAAHKLLGYFTAALPTENVRAVACALGVGATVVALPLVALAGVLLVTAWRMNEWHAIRFYVARRLKEPTLIMLATTAATVALDLTQAIVVGVALSLLIFISQVSRLEVVPMSADWAKLRGAGLPFQREVAGMQVVYISGSLYFGATGQPVTELERLGHQPALIFSMRGVPMVEVKSGILCTFLHAPRHGLA